jgi:phospholipase/carboxylesterase
MVYRFHPKWENSLYMFEQCCHYRIPYYSKQEMGELYPNGGYEIIGEIGNIAKAYNGQDMIDCGTGKLTPIFPRGTLKRPFEWVAGYAAVGENTYVAVVKGLLPRKNNLLEMKLTKL